VLRKSMNTKKQLGVFAILLGVYMLLALVTYLFIPFEQLTAGTSIPVQVAVIPRWQLGLVSATGILVIYGLMGLAGNWFARKLKIPQTYHAGAGWKAWLLWPLLLGIVLGVLFVVIERSLIASGMGVGFPHPAFPFSIIASATAGIGEEILARSFIMGLWAFLLNLILRRWKATQVALWAGNVIAALAFSATHIPAVMYLLQVSSPAQIPVFILLEVFLLNGILGLAAGERYMRDGLVAAVGVHFWADIVWHVIYPLIASALSSL